MPFPMKSLFNLLLKQVHADKTEMERLIAAGYKCWEIVRPGRLSDGAMTRCYRVLDELAKAWAWELSPAPTWLTPWWRRRIVQPTWASTWRSLLLAGVVV